MPAEVSLLPSLMFRMTHHDTSFLRVPAPHLSCQVMSMAPSGQPYCFPLASESSHLLSITPPHPEHAPNAVASLQAHTLDYTSEKLISSQPMPVTGTKNAAFPILSLC